MSETITISATARSVKGKGASRRLRRLNDLVPGIVYGAGKEAKSIEIEHRIIKKATQDEHFFSQVLNLETDGKTEQVMLKDLQRHPYKPQIMHLDFLRIDANKEITSHIPVHVTGQEASPAIKSGMVLSHTMVEITVKCLPKDLPESFEVDISTVADEHVVHMSDLKLPKGVVIPELALGEGHDQTVISIHKPKIVAEEEEVEVAASEVPAEKVSSDDDAAEAKAEGKGENKKD